MAYHARSQRLQATLRQRGRSEQSCITQAACCLKAGRQTGSGKQDPFFILNSRKSPRSKTSGPASQQLQSEVQVNPRTCEGRAFQKVPSTKRPPAPEREKALVRAGSATGRAAAHAQRRRRPRIIWVRAR